MGEIILPNDYNIFIVFKKILESNLNEEIKDILKIYKKMEED